MEWVLFGGTDLWPSPQSSSPCPYILSQVRVQDLTLQVQVLSLHVEVQIVVISLQVQVQVHQKSELSPTQVQVWDLISITLWRWLLVFGRPYYRLSLWYSVSSVCLSVVCRLSSVTFCIVAKRYVLAKNCLKERIGNQGQKVHFFGRCHISTSGFAGTPPRWPFFALCIVAKRYVLAKNCLKEWIGNQGQRVHFGGRRHISTSGFASMAT